MDANGSAAVDVNVLKEEIEKFIFQRSGPIIAIFARLLNQ